MIELDVEKEKEGNLIGAVSLLMAGFVLGILVTGICYHLVIK